MRTALTICFALALAGCSPSCQRPAETVVDTAQAILGKYHLVPQVRVAGGALATLDVNANGWAWDASVTGSIAIFRVGAGKRVELMSWAIPADTCGAVQLSYDDGEVVATHVRGVALREGWPFVECPDVPTSLPASKDADGARSVELRRWRE